jgi:hypothetical protein
MLAANEAFVPAKAWRHTFTYIHGTTRFIFPDREIRHACRVEQIGGCDSLRFADPHAYREKLVRDHDLNIDHAKGMHPGLVDRQPPLLVQLDDETTVCIDGAHRLWRAITDLMTRQRSQIMAWVVTIEELRRTALVAEEDAP